LGAIKCWGFNAYGQLGNGSAVDSRLPVDVLGLASGVKAVAVGHYHTCALTNEGGVRCWGDNYGGALGNGSDVDSTTPVIVDFTTHQITRETIGLRTSVPAGAIPRGMVATFVATVRPVGADGTKATVHFVVYHRVSGVWRQATHRDVIANATGRATLRWSFSTGGAWYVRAKVLGNASYAASGWSPQFRYTVINASMPTNIAITAGYSHTCALTDRGGVRCWGDNDIGQLGNSTTTDSLVPVDVASLASGVTAIAAGNGHTCALMGDGGVRCWGYNGFGELGNGTTTKSLIPVDVTSLASDATAIFAGDDHTCALTSAGRVKCWGSNDFGQLGNGSITSYSSIPVVAGLPSGVVAIAGGFGTTCALTSAGGVRCWGTGFQGQLGNGQTSDSLTPVDVTGLARGVAAIAAGSYQTCALTSGGGVKCWGVGASGQLGDSTVADSAVPIVVTGLGSGVTAVAVGTIHRCALTMGGGVKCWGWDRSGQLGDGKVTPSSVPVDVWGLGTGVTAIAAGTTHSCALMKSGGVKCWGANDSGQLGNGRTTDSSVPVDVKFGT